MTAEDSIEYFEQRLSGLQLAGRLWSLDRDDWRTRVAERGRLDEMDYLRRRIESCKAKMEEEYGEDWREL